MNFTNRDFIYLALLFTLMFIITACGKDVNLARTEYFLNEEWKTCAQTASEPCGLSLLCGEELFSCVTNVQSR